MFTFDVVPGAAVAEILRERHREVIEIVRRTYLAHDRGESVAPDSQFLRFPDRPDSRIIALPAYLGGDVRLAGIKWIASVPANTRIGVPRASAVLILNDPQTGHPVACLEAGAISAARTAASAALAAAALRLGGYRGTTTAVVGAGVIARKVCEYLDRAGCAPDAYLVHDLDVPSGQALVEHLRSAQRRPASFTADLERALEADTVLFATTALVPYVRRPFRPGQLVLHLSLRDLSPEVVLAADNLVDDVEHCLKADTSPHLAEQVSGSRDFVTGTLAQILTGRVTTSTDRPVIFSPFGLGVLDLAVGAYVHRRARETGRSIAVEDFFAETTRWPKA